jgi:hypothetical protein
MLACLKVPQSVRFEIPISRCRKIETGSLNHHAIRSIPPTGSPGHCPKVGCRHSRHSVWRPTYTTEAGKGS